jgi:uncharacterized membrane protein
MSDQILLTLTFLSALGCGLIAGVFYAFSTFVMKALAVLPPVQGIAAMQSINVVVINPWFMTAFLGTGAVCAALAVCAVLRWNEPPALCLLSGSLLYLLGTIGVTMAFNVPRNDTLAAMTPANPESAALWAEYVSSWTTWNHVRTAAALTASALLIVALYLQRGGRAT